MKSFTHRATELTPEIILAPAENRFVISGKSAPEDVRGLYYPVVEWMEAFAAEVKNGNNFTDSNPLRLKLDLEYFNSSSAKFLLDVLNILSALNDEGIPVEVEWHYDEEDVDLCEAGEDLSLLCELTFRYCPKTR